MPLRENATNNVRFRRRESKTSSTGENENVDPKDYTEDDLVSVERIKQCTNYYEILGVPKDAGDSELRKQYKKLALQFHPDKNKTPGAVEAFKAIGNAFSVLSDTEKRKQYDMYGHQGPPRMRAHDEHDYQGFTYTFSDEGISPEELFNMFFNSGGYTNVGTTYVRRGNRWHRYENRTAYDHQQQTHQSQHRYHRQEDSHSVLLQMLPLLIIFILAMFSNFFVSDPPYSLVRTAKFIQERRTGNLGAPYYVKESFIKEFGTKIEYIEKHVEEDYLSNMKSSCYRERNYKESMIWRAKTFRDISLEEKARNLRTPSCDTLNDLYMNQGY